MASQFPPSSPSISTVDHHYELDSPNSSLNHGIHSDSDSALHYNKKEDVLANESKDFNPHSAKDVSFNLLPTPEPSSCLNQSSPIKNSKNNYHNDHATANKSILKDLVEQPQHTDVSETISSSPKSSSSSFLTSSQEKYTPVCKKKYPVIEIPLKYNAESLSTVTKVTLGRKSSNNDISLPHDKLISRNHLVIYYYPSSNQLKIKCLGLNGVCVIYPKNLVNHRMVLAEGNGEKTYELTMVDSSNILTHVGLETDNIEIIKRKKLTSFVIKQNQTVLMPFVKNMMLDFQKFEALITINRSINTTEVPDSSVINEAIVPTPVSLPVHKEKKRKLTSHQNDAKKKKTKKDDDHEFNDFAELDASLASKEINIEELTRILINHLAYASIQQVPLSSLLQINSVVSKLNKRELRYLLIKKCGECVGVIYRVGKDAAGKPLEEEYYYEINNDKDQERKAIIESLKGGRANLRNCRKTHKQYFWKKPR